MMFGEFLLALGPIWWLAQPRDENRAKAAMAINDLIIFDPLKSHTWTDVIKAGGQRACELVCARVSMMIEISAGSAGHDHRSCTAIRGSWTGLGYRVLGAGRPPDPGGAP